jgi:hypothetical protein
MALRQEYEYQSMTLNCSLGNDSFKDCFREREVTNFMQIEVLFDIKNNKMDKETNLLKKWDCNSYKKPN